MQTLLDEAIRDGLLRVDRNGIIRRTALAKVSPRETPTRPIEQTLAIPPDIRVNAAIRRREAETGRPVNQLVRSYAEELEAGRGTLVHERAMAQVKSDPLIKKADALELAHIVGIRPTAKTSKAEALKGIEQRHLEFKKALERRAEDAALFSFVSQRSQGDLEGRGSVGASGTVQAELGSAKTRPSSREALFANIPPARRQEIADVLAACRA